MTGILRFFNLAMAVVLFCASPAIAADLSPQCLNQWRERITIPLLSLEKNGNWDLSQRRAGVKSTPPTFVVSRDRHAQIPSELSVNFLDSRGFSLRQTLALEPSSVRLRLETSQFKRGIPTQSTERQWEIGDDCQIREVEFKEQTFTVKKKLVTIHEFTRNSLSAKRTTQQTSLTLLKNRQRLDQLLDSNIYTNKKVAHEERFQAYLSTEWPIVQVIAHRERLPGTETQSDRVWIVDKGQVLSEILAETDLKAKKTITYAGATESLEFSKEDFLKLSLQGQRRRAALAIRGSPHEFAQAKYFAITIANPNTFDSLNNYWSEEQPGLFSPRQTNKEVREQFVGFDTTSVDSEIFLRSTDIIEANAPEIKSMARQAWLYGKSDRAKLIKGILDQVHRHLTYDPQYRNQDWAQTQSATTIAQTGKGVCQQFSVLFTSIARALSLPTRIVVGWRLDSQEPHAWVEVLGLNRRWIPVEPQNRDLRFESRHYWPIAVSSLLDNPKDEEAAFAEASLFASQRIEIYPVIQSRSLTQRE